MDSEKIDDTEIKKASRFVRAGIVLVVIALLGMLVMGLNSCGNSDKEKMQQQLDSLKLANDRLQLTNQYDSLNRDFQQFENQAQYLQNDSLLEQYAQAKDKVQKLLAELKSEKATNRKRIQELQGEISTLKDLLRHYVAVIDSLGKENSELRDLNERLQNQNQQLSSTVSDYTQRNQQLSERMQLAEKLNLTGLSFQALNKKGKNEKKISKAQQLLVSFTIPQNNSTPVGEKTFYVRIVSPEGNVLGAGRTFPFEGGSVAYTEKKTVEYDQQEMSLSVYHNVSATLSKGTYLVEVFVDNYRLVSRNFQMTK